MPRTRHYVHTDNPGVSIETTGTLAELETADRDRVTISVESDVASTFAFDVKFSPNGSWVQDWDNYSSVDSVSDVKDLTVYAVRVRNTTAQTSGDTADVRLGAE